MDEQEVAYAIGWLLVLSGILAVLVVSCFPRRGYRTTTAGLLLIFVGLLIAGHTWAAVVVFVLTLARYGHYLYLPLSALQRPTCAVVVAATLRTMTCMRMEAPRRWRP